jgi:hypothetical protein
MFKQYITLLYTILYLVQAKAQPVLNMIHKFSPNVNSGGCLAVHKFDNTNNIYIYGNFRGTVDFDPGAGIYNLTSASTEMDIFITKLDQQGNFLWAKKIGNTGVDRTSSIQFDNSNNIYLAGAFSNTVDFDPGVGINNMTSVSNQDGFILKLDSNANFIFSKSFGGFANEIPNIIFDNQSNLFMFGSFQNTVDFDPGNGVYNLTATGNTSEMDGFIVKLDSNANFIWGKQLGGIGNDLINEIKISQNDDLYIYGYFKDTVNFNLNGGIFNMYADITYGDMFLMSMKNNGDFKWAKEFNGNFSRIATDMTIDSMKNVYFVGYFEDSLDIDPGIATNILVTPSFSINSFIGKLDSNGHFIWGKQLNGRSNHAYTLCLDKDKNVYTSGVFRDTCDFDPNAGINHLITNNYSNDAYVLKLNTNGIFEWAINIAGGSSTDQSVAFSIDVDNFYNVSLAGYFFGTCDFNPGTSSFNLSSVSDWADAYFLKLLSNSTSSSYVKDNTSVSLYPNPTSAFVEFKADNSIKNVFVSIIDIQGNVIWKKHFKEFTTQTFDLTGFNRGIYILKIQNSSISSTSKIIKL